MNEDAEMNKIRIATLDDANEIYNLMKEVYERLEDKDLFVCDDLDYIISQISGNGFAVVACNEEGKIIGSFLIRYPGGSLDNLGRDIGLKEEELEKVAHMESVVVHPDFRGQGLQSQMLRFAENRIEKKAYFLATVSPYNPASCRSFEKNGYEHVMTKEKYGGLVRRIYKKMMLNT